MKKTQLLILLGGLLLLFDGCQKDNIVTIDPVVVEDADDDIANTSFTQTVYVAFSESSNASVTGTNDDFAVIVSGNHVTLVYSGDEYVMYELSGTATDGCFKLYSSRKQALALNGLNLTNPNGAVIDIQGGRTFVLLSEENALSGGAATTDDSENYTLFSEGSLVFCGSGSLDVTNSGAGCKGISCNSNGSFTNGTVSVTVTGNNTSSKSAKAIKFDGNLVFTGGKVVAKSTAHEGIEAKGTITINGGEIYSYSQSDDAFNSGGDFTISGGYVYGQSAGNDGLDANGNCYIKGGVLYAIGSRSPEVAIDANSEGGYKLYVEGGTLVAIGGLESGSSLSQSCYQASSWSQSTWYALTVGSTTYAFKTPSSGGTPLVVSGASTPTLTSDVSASGGTAYFEGLFYEDATVSGGSSVSLSSYTGSNGGGGGPGGGGHGPF
jgi:hypothetical protein